MSSTQPWSLIIHPTNDSQSQILVNSLIFLDLKLKIIWIIGILHFFKFYPSCTSEHEILEKCCTFLIKYCNFFISIFSIFFFLLVLHSNVCETPRSFTNPHTRCPKKIESRVEHGTNNDRVYCWSKSNAYSLLLLALHMRCLVAAALVRRFFTAAHDRRIAPPLLTCLVSQRYCSSPPNLFGSQC